MLYQILVLLFSLSFSDSSRSDEVSILNASPPWSLKGGSKTPIYCPDNTWASGFNVRHECDNVGIVYVKFDCVSIEGNVVSYIQNNDGGDWGSFPWAFDPFDQYCESSHFIVGFRAQGDCCTYSDNDLSMNELIMTCSSGTNIDPTGCEKGKWSNYQACPASSAFCGFNYVFYDYTYVYDNVAMENIEGKCCRICSPFSSVFQSVKNCNFCDMSCLTCSGSLTSCTSCGRSDTLSSQTCVNDPMMLKVIEEFKGTTTAAFNSEYTNNNWSGTYSFYSMVPWYMLGKYGYGKYVTKTLSNLVPHYKARIKVRYYKMDNWNGESCKINIDGTDQTIPPLVNWQGSDKLHKLYYGDMNNAVGYENTLFIDVEFTHNVPTMTIKFYSTLTSSNSVAFWGISHFGLYVFRCHPTCQTCSGGSSNTQCLTCYGNATLQNSLCVCNDKYYAQTTSPCITTICTICQTCYTGCNHCTGGGQTQCTSCYTGYYFYNNQCYQICPTSPSKFGDPATLTCVDACKSNEYYDSTRVCKTCNSNCYKCVGTATSCTACTGSLFLENNACTSMCSLNHYGVLSSHTCQSDCEDYFFKHLVDRLCYQRCPSGFFGNVITKFCTAICPDGMYADPLTVLCQYCQFNCLKCTGSATSCDACKYTWLNSDSTCSNPSYTKALKSRLFITKPISNSDVISTGFTVSGAVTANYANTCASSLISYYVIGGPASLSSGKLSQTFALIQAHFRARVTFFFLKIDNWQNNSVIVRADSVSVPTNITFTSEDSSIMKLCGTSSLTEAVRPIDVIFTHNSSSLYLEITTDLTVAPNVASWGIFDLSVFIDACHTLCKTCVAATQFDCLSCNDGLYMQTTPGPSLCDPLCPEGFYTDPSSNSCPPCNSSCQACSGPLPTNCLRCYPGTFLTVVGSSSTCGSCASGTWSDLINGICSVCDPNCLTCSGGSFKECLSCVGTKYFYDNQCWSKCSDGTFGVNGTMTCEKSCPANSFPYEGSNTCWPCNNCVKCTGIADNQCTVCFTGHFLEEGKCVNSCSLDHFVNPANASCDRCTEFCSVCSSLTTCSKCLPPTYLRTPFNVSCIKCTNNGEIPNDATGVCLVCDNNCDVCASFTTCSICENGYYLLNSNNKCAPQKSLQAVLKTSSDPTIVNILFSDKWEYLFNLLDEKISLNITNHGKDEYTYVISQDAKISQQFNIQFQFTKNIIMGDLLNLIIDFPDSKNDEFLLKNKEFSLVMSMYCVPPTIYLISAVKCVEPINIIPILQLTSTATNIVLKFSNEYGRTYIKYLLRSKITIEGFNQSSFNYSIQQTSSIDIFNIYLNFSSSFSNKPLLHLNLFPPTQILYDQSTNLRLSKYDLQINLPDYYALDSNTKSLISNTNGATDSLNQATSDAFMANNFMSTGGSFAFRAMISMDVIRFLRFFLIDYPPNVIAMFETSMPTSDLIPNVNLEENELDGQLPNIFNGYGMSIYVFNNNGNIIIEALCYISAGIAVLLLLKIFKNTRNRYFRMVLLIFRMVFVWNYGLSYFLSAFMNFSLSTFLAYKYPTTQTKTGIFNFIFAILDGFILLGIVFFCFNIITKLRPHILFTKKSAVHPEQIKNLGTEDKTPSKVSNNNTDPFAKAKTDPNDDAIITNDKNNSLLQEQDKKIEATPTSSAKKTTFNKNNEPEKKGSQKVLYFFPDKSIFQKYKSSEIQKEKEIEKIIVEDLDTIEKKVSFKEETASEKTHDNSINLKVSFKEETTSGKNQDISINLQKRNDDSPKGGDKSTCKESNDNLNKIDEPEPESGREGFSQEEQIVTPQRKGIIPYIFRKISRRFGGQNSSPFAFGDEEKETKEEQRENNTTNTPISQEQTWFSKIKSKMKNIITKKRKNSDWREINNDEMGKFTESLELLNKAFFPLHKDFNHSTAPQSYYILFDLCRQIIFSAIVVGLFDQPLAGIILINIINICYIICFLVVGPFKSKQDFIQNLLNEICLFLCSISAFVLVCMERIGVNDLGLRMKIGWVMVGCNFFLIAVFLIRISVTLSMMFYLLCRLLVKKIIYAVCRKKNQVHTEEKEENEAARKKSEGAVLQQIIEIENFLR